MGFCNSFLPAFENLSVVNSVVLSYWVVIIFLVIIALTIPFDVRDLEYDHASLRTLPMVMGEKRAVSFAQLLLIISCFILYFAQTHLALLFRKTKLLFAVVFFFYFSFA